VEAVAGTLKVRSPAAAPAWLQPEADGGPGGPDHE
jgi:hypothetical protein